MENLIVVEQFISELGLFWESVEHQLGEGNGTPLQYSCLENPVDGGAWWAAVHAVTQSRTQQKQLRRAQHRKFYFLLAMLE